MFLNRSCEEHKYHQFSDIDAAKQACKEDKNCSAIYDVECRGVGIFHLCLDQENVGSQFQLSNSDVSTISCIHEKIIVGKKFGMLPNGKLYIDHPI